MRPKTVVLRYFSWPQRSMRVTLRSLWFTTSAHRCRCDLAVGTTYHRPRHGYVCDRETTCN